MTGSVYTVRVQTDGAILICGPFSKVKGTARNSFARLGKTGVLDTAYYPGAGPNNSVFTCFIHNDGAVVLGGPFTAVNGYTRNYCARLLTSGALDPDFNPSLTAHGGFSVSSVRVQPDGRVVLGGFFGGTGGTIGDKVFSLARFYGDGTLDTGFDSSLDTNGTVRSFALQPDNAIVVGGYFVVLRGQTRHGVGRLYSSGGVDPTFDPGAGANGNVLAVAVQANGKVVVGGVFTNFAGVARPYLARLNS